MLTGNKCNNNSTEPIYINKIKTFIDLRLIENSFQNRNKNITLKGKDIHVLILIYLNISMIA